MAKDLTTSQIDRQNVLNNPYALQAIQNNLDIKFLNFKGTLYVTRQMAADFYEVDVRTISNCLSANEEELTFNGYKVIKGNLLKEYKLHFGKEIDFPTKTTVLGVFDFRSFLNLGMLLTTSEKAKQLRSMMLDIVIATINPTITENLALHISVSHFLEIRQLHICWYRCSNFLCRFL